MIAMSRRPILVPPKSPQCRPRRRHNKLPPEGGGTAPQTGLGKISLDAVHGEACSLSAHHEPKSIFFLRHEPQMTLEAYLPPIFC